MTAGAVVHTTSGAPRSKVVLISTDEGNSGIGVRTLSACLLEGGFDPRIVLMGTFEDTLRMVRWPDLSEICRDALLVGISCMTHGVAKAVEIRNALREAVSCPVVIGGIHASMDPESLTGSFDLICHGEGEDLLVELACRLRDKTAYDDIPGLWVRRDSGWIRNPAHPLRKDINDYPLPDYDLGRHHILDGHRVVPMTLERVERDFFVVLGSRGCPHRCTYCCNRAIKEKFPWRRHVQHYTVDTLIRHLRTAGEAYPVIRSFWIDDDTFFAKSLPEIEEFARRYRSEVGKPYMVLISPWTFRDEKLRPLVESGLSRLIMGIQSGSDRTNREVYGRNLPGRRIMEIAHSLHEYSGRMQVCYDFIGMNPFETADDLVASIRFIRSLPPPFFIYHNSLAFYPGTELHARIAQTGMDVGHRVQHSDVEIGYKILLRERIDHKVFHLILLRMQDETRGWRVGHVPRILLSDTCLAFFRFLDRKLKPLSDGIAVALAWVSLRLHWRRLVRSLLGPARSARLYRYVLRLSGAGS